MAGLLCEEEVLEVDNVKYCGYCKYHFSKMVSLLGQGIPRSAIPSKSALEGVDSGPGRCLALVGQRWKEPSVCPEERATG